MYDMHLLWIVSQLWVQVITFLLKSSSTEVNFECFQYFVKVVKNVSIVLEFELPPFKLWVLIKIPQRYFPCYNFYWNWSFQLVGSS